MQVADQRLQPFFQHMGIDLRGRNICVSEKGLHHAQVCAVVQQALVSSALGSTIEWRGYRYDLKRPPMD